MDESLEQTVANKIRRMKIALYSLGTIGAISVIIFVSALIVVTNEEPAYDPLGNYPLQTVQEEEIIDGSKVVFAYSLVTVAGTKCNNSDNIVEVEGELNWESIDPPGSIIQVGRGQAEMEPGCTTQVFKNTIPPDVKDVIEDQHDNGIAAPLWRVSGIEWPIDEDGNRGVPRRFKTENFIVLEGDS